MNLPANVTLQPGQVAAPVLWRALLGGSRPDASDAVLLPRFDGGRHGQLKTWGHDAQTVHWLAARGGLPLHWDPGAVRYSYQWIVRNDGWYLHGLDPTLPAPMPAGTIILLDTHSPHKVTRDRRLGGGPYYVALVYDVPAPLPRPQDAWTIMRRRAADPTVETPVLVEA